MNKTLANKAQSFGCFVNKNAGRITLAMLLCMAMGATVFAAAGADTLWALVAGLIETWVTRIGGVVMLVGGVIFGLGWEDNDASQKTTGINTLAAGAIVVAVAQLTGTFMS